MLRIQASVGCLRGVGRSLRGLIRAWWDVDRVRISPREGKLLGLVPPCVISVRGEPFQIVNRRESTKRTESSDETIACVRYDCSGAGGSGRLHVRLAGARELQVTWAISDSVSTLEEHQIEIFG